MTGSPNLVAAAAGTVRLGDLTVNRMGFGAMRVTGAGIWGDPPDRGAAKRLLVRAVELGVNFLDTADSYGPEVSERIIAEALFPYPAGLVIGTKGARLKSVGRAARLSLNELLGRRVHLNTWVKVREGWSDDDRMLRQLGHEPP